MSDPNEQTYRVRLFDEDGLPWTSRVRWGMLLFWLAILWFVFAPIVGIYLGIWLISKGKSALSLVLYVVLTSVWVAVFLLPGGTHRIPSSVELALEVSSSVLWLVGAYALRLQVMRYYSDQEGIPFPLSPVLTALFGPWYVSGHLRATFPLDGTGRAGTGILKLDTWSAKAEPKP